MNIHSLAKTTPLCRWSLVKCVMVEHNTVVSTAERFRVSPRTVHKWLARFRTEGFLGLYDRTSRPLSYPRQLPAPLIDEIHFLRTLELTCDAIAHFLQQARSTVAKWLGRLGLGKLSGLVPKPPVQRYEHDNPGDLVHLDIKKLAKIQATGHRITGDPSKRKRGAGWERLHTCIDDHGRLAYAEILPDEKAVTTADFLERALENFRLHGISVKALLTDNGPCYRSDVFGNACEKHGIKHRKTRPYRPQTNGKAERFIRTTMEEWGWVTAFSSSEERAADLQNWIEYYNWSRPHSALGYETPISRLSKLGVLPNACPVNNLSGIYN
jgi:transposase InsO family protein